MDQALDLSVLSDPSTLPLATLQHAGVGGQPRSVEDFIVEEIPAYDPAGTGTHCFIQIRKQGLSTQQALARLSKAYNVAARDIGYAGLKDRRGITSQWVSVPGVTPKKALSTPTDDALTILRAEMHPHKLRTGHLRGNRFRITLRGTNGSARQAQTILEELQGQGMPNYYGPQRFGRQGDNAARGYAMLKTTRGRWPSDRSLRRLLISALQSAIFNGVAARRVLRKVHATALRGDVMQLGRRAKYFTCRQPSAEQARVALGEISPTGPICGPRMPRPEPDSVARQVEDEVLDGLGIEAESFGHFGRLARGGRRALSVLPQESSAEQLSDAIRLTFTLPPGSYATVLLREVSKSTP